MSPGTCKRASMPERFSALPVDRLSITTTSFSLARASARLEPMKPEPPVMTNFLDVENGPWKKCDILEIHAVGERRRDLPDRD